MYLSFITDLHNDLKFEKIILSDENTDAPFLLAIKCSGSAEALHLAGVMIAFRGLYEMDASSYQNFEVKVNDKNNCVVEIVGNIDNAIKILHERGLISDAIYQKIMTDQNAIAILTKSKNFILKQYDDLETTMESAKFF